MLEVLFPVFVSTMLHVIVAKLLNVPHVALTVHVMIIVSDDQLNRLHIFNVNTFPAMLHVDVMNPVKPAGNVSLITMPVAVFGQAFEYKSV
jgi:hypothetical protein